MARPDRRGGSSSSSSSNGRGNGNVNTPGTSRRGGGSGNGGGGGGSGGGGGGSGSGGSRKKRLAPTVISHRQPSPLHTAGRSRNGPRGAFAVSLDNDSAFPKLGQASAGEYNTVKWNNQRTTAVAALFQPAAMIAAQNDFKATIEASSPRRQPSQPPGVEGRRGSGGGVFGEAAQPPAEPPVLKPKAKRRISPRLVEHGPAHHAARNMPFSTATAAAAPNGIGGGSSDGNAGGVETSSAFQRANLSSSAITTTAAAATIGISTSVSAVSTTVTVTVTTTPPTSPQPQPKALSNGSAAASASVSAPSSSGCNTSAAAVVPLPGLGSGSDGEDQDLKIALFAELVGRLVIPNFLSCKTHGGVAWGRGAHYHLFWGGSLIFESTLTCNIRV